MLAKAEISTPGSTLEKEDKMFWGVVRVHEDNEPGLLANVPRDLLP